MVPKRRRTELQEIVDEIEKITGPELDHVQVRFLFEVMSSYKDMVEVRLLAALRKSLPKKYWGVLDRAWTKTHEFGTAKRNSVDDEESDQS